MRPRASGRAAVFAVLGTSAFALLLTLGGGASAEDAPATITIEVAAPGLSEGFAFSGGDGSTTFSTTLFDGDTYTLAGIEIDTEYGTQVGIVQAVEEEPLRSRLSDITCVENVGFFPTGSVDYGAIVDDGYVWVQPRPGQDITCTFTNANVAGSFGFGPVVSFGDRDEEFTFDSYLESTPETLSLGSGQTRWVTDLAVPSQYTVYQRLEPGWETVVDCEGSASWWSEVEGESIYARAEFGDGDHLSCTFFNTYVGSSLTVELQAPGPIADVPFAGYHTAGGDFPFTLRHGERHTEPLIVGDGILVAVDETVPAGWRVTDIDCTAIEYELILGIPVTRTIDPYTDPNMDVDVERGFLQVSPEPGVHVTCVFHNSYVAGSLSFGPEVVSGDPDQFFTYDARLDRELSVSLTDGASYGDELLSVPGQYAVSQRRQPGWETTVECRGGDVVSSGDDPSGDVYAHIQIDEYEDVRCTFLNTYVNEPPVADAGGPYVVEEGSTVVADGTGSFDPDADALTYEWDLDADGEYDDATGVAPVWSYPDGPDSVVVGLRVTDPLGETDTATAVVQVLNVAPAPVSPSVTPDPSDEGGAVTVSASFTDPGSFDTHTCTVDHGDGSGPLAGTVSGGVCIGPVHVYADDGEYPVTVIVVDDDGGIGSADASHTVLNVPPAVTVAPVDQALQYSDRIEEITVNATDVAADTLTAAVSWSVDGGPVHSGPPDGLALTPGACIVDGGLRTCDWTLSGPIRVPTGAYTLHVEVVDDDGGATVADVAIVVEREDASLVLGADNPVAVDVDDPGSDESRPFTLLAYVQEAPETGASEVPGDINRAEVSVMLEPVGPGGTIGPVACSSTGPVTPYDATARLEVACELVGIPVNAYVATVSVGGDFYRGNTDEDVVVVYDPSLGFTTGGGWFLWPDTGERTTFGYTMKYNKKGTNVQGSMVMIRRGADGERTRLKSNALSGLALGETADMGWATFLGKATYLEPGMAEAEGNHSFTVYVEDHGEPGAGSDRFWIEVHDKDDAPASLSLDRPAAEHSVVLGGGNIVVPHRPNGAATGGGAGSSVR